MEKLIPVALLLVTVFGSGVVSLTEKSAIPNENNPDIQLPILRLSAANLDFALRLYRQIASQSRSAAKNIFFSPVSVSAALSMLSLGARDNTVNQLLRVLGYSDMSRNDAAEVHEAYKYLLQKLTRENSELNLTMGNSLHIQQEFVVKQKFLEDAKQFYKAEVMDVNFKEPENAKEQINAYINKKTSGEIQDFVKSLDRSTVMLLLNYVLFKGSWMKPFDPTATYEADFHVDNTTTVRVQMMKRLGMYYSGYDQQISSYVVSIPYHGNASLVLILPAPGKLAEVEQNLNISHFQNFFFSLPFRSATLHLPKLLLKESYQLKELLMSMGIVDVFTDNSNLSGISETTLLKVSEVTHEAVLDIDETGTKATAVTGVEIIPFSVPSEYVFNRPFFLLIADHNVKSVLFAGRNVALQVILRSSRQEKMKAEIFILLISGELMITMTAQQHHCSQLQQPRNFSSDSEHNAEAIRAPEPVPDMQAIYTLTEKNREFGFNLYRKIANLHEDNVFFSPITISTMFAMMSLGAKQVTSDDILQVLNVKDLIKMNNPYLLHTLFQWLHCNVSSNKDLLISGGIALFVQDDIHLKPTYINDASYFYNADIIPVDFQDAANATDIINQYIDNRTNGKINKLLDSVDSKTKLLFTNYILFKGKWMAPFDPNGTKDGIFYINAYTRIKVPMMFKEDTFFLTHDKTHSCIILKIPYQGNASMLVVIPKNGEYLHVEDELTTELLAKWINALKPKKIELYFPKFKLNKLYDMERKLRQLGIITPFTNTANFSGISSSYHLKISKVIHKATIDVNERGTEAAAVTSVSAVPYSLPTVIKVDHPFVFLIYEEITNMLLFMGRVKDPTKS
ncbi:protein Z-dependent protease inhibitor-like [Hemiscyllium ocellatum]|uniref:protein Z-dependent protease inhibitor-like n=1 Tax=Hemiscyllium ocellatum TaxID=170820 RepID=UPI0029665EAD|nr:protein Z-dependent protease inhibitor-like [Hemiscyllium ocellatum]